MCKIKVHDNKCKIDERVIINNTILAQKNKFSIEEIGTAVSKFAVTIESVVIVKCVNDLLESGFLYEDGFDYVVRHNKQRWGHI